MKSGNLNFLEPSGPLQACNGTALPLPFSWFYYKEICYHVRSHERKKCHILLTIDIIAVYILLIIKLQFKMVSQNLLHLN